MLQNIKKDNKGFTLVELIVVIAILGVLMAVLVPQYIQYVEKSRQTADANSLNEMFHAVETQAALSEATIPDIVTLTVSPSGTVTLDNATTDKSFEKDVATVINSSFALRSKAAKKATKFIITFDATTKHATWDAHTSELITKLAAGTATEDDGSACKGT